ncbi:hypothetical protein [Methanosphaera sp. WGK6]|uniref:hypothetical protein n=1 Tax=Methanosphaera sp. WGK6 TaxID=1561964 RepID=UPI00084BC59E|nr:hypothetical protein [Methanosphaera sp. WGK6]OED30358.1 hypothetical protein NL43_03000 [Methanosphaera sp. WGK6]
MNKKKLQRKITGSLFIFVSIYYLLVEYMTITSKTSISNAYLYQPIVDVSINSGQIIHELNIESQSILISIAFILLGLMILIGCFLEINKRINRFEIFYYPLMIITGVGAILLGCYYTGISEVIITISTSYFMFIIGGNLLLIVMGKSVNFNKVYKKLITLLGFIGLISIILMIVSLNIPTMNIFKVLFERFAIYMIIIWNILTGICLINE